MTGRLLFDVTGQLQWYANLQQASGIQRVTEHVLGSSSIRDYPHVEFIARPIGSSQFFRLDTRTVQALCDNDQRIRAIGKLRGTFAQTMQLAPLLGCLREARYFDLPYLLAGVMRLENAVARLNGSGHVGRLPPLKPILPPGPQDTFLNTGDFWCHRAYADAVVGLRQSSRVRLVVLVHDLFYINNPEWNHSSFSDFRDQLGKLALHVNTWMVTSNFVKSQLLDYLGSRALLNSDIRVLPMGGGVLTLPTPVGAEEAQTVLRKFGLQRERYFLTVGKIEPRRNHLALLDAFETVRRGSSAPLPICVIVGQDGWKSHEFRARLRSTLNEQNTVKWLRQVTDRELSILYANASFCVVPSKAEGWGLPIRESLAHGIPCLASCLGGSLEAGQDNATYFDPRTPGALASALYAWLTDDRALEDARRQIASRLPTKDLSNWEAAGRAILAAAFPDGPYPSALS